MTCSHCKQLVQVRSGLDEAQHLHDGDVNDHGLPCMLMTTATIWYKYTPKNSNHTYLFHGLSEVMAAAALVNTGTQQNWTCSFPSLGTVD